MFNSTTGSTTERERERERERDGRGREAQGAQGLSVHFVASDQRFS